MNPNFLFIGPNKAGSTWIYKVLRQHPDIYLPTVKELFFFDLFYDKGWTWYERFFEEVGAAHKIVGEVSHDYLYSYSACERIAHHLPDVKLMVCLRDPVERAFSAYLYMVRQGRINVDFERAIAEVEELIEHGRYAKHLDNYLKHFRRDQLHVAIYDDLRADPQRFVDSICDFLGVERLQLSADMKKVALPAAKPRSKYWAGLARSIGWQVRRMGLPEVTAKIKESSLLNWVLYKAYDRNDKPSISASARESLRKAFLSDVQGVDQMFGTDLGRRWGYTQGMCERAMSSDADGSAQTG